MNNRISVFIPIISPNNVPIESNTPIKTSFIEVYSQSSRIIKETANSPLNTKENRNVWSELEHKAIDKYWDLVAAPLRVSSPVLYKSGCTAVNAIRKLQIKRPLWGLYQHFKPDAALEAQRLYSVNVSGPTEGNSAELGLAIALAANLFDVTNCIIVATGALSATSVSQSTPLIRQGDVKIHPVSQLKNKLTALEEDISNGVFSEMIQSKSMLVFTPKYIREDDNEIEVDQIPEVQRLRSLGVFVIPVNWLSEVLNALQAYQTRYLFQDRLILTFLGLFFVFSVTYFSWVNWNKSHIPMQFVQAGPYEIPAEPFELCKLGKLQYAKALEKQYSIPVISVASTLAWKSMIGDPNSMDAFFAHHLGYQGYFIIVIVVSELSPITFDYMRNDHTNSPLRISPGEFFEGWIKLNDTAEVNVLMLLAQRFETVDIEQLREQFNERFLVSNVGYIQKTPLNVDAVSDFFTRLVPGTLSYPFLTVMEQSKCVS